MTIPTWKLTIVCVALASAAAVLSACGEGSESDSGGTVRIGLTAEPDALDPALSYSPEVWESLYTPRTSSEPATPASRYALRSSASGSSSVRWRADAEARRGF